MELAGITACAGQFPLGLQPIVPVAVTLSMDLLSSRTR